MKKNLKGCTVQYPIDHAELLVNVTDRATVESAGMKLDAVHKKSGAYAAAWSFSDTTAVRFPLRAGDLSSYRYLSLAVFATAGEGGSFSLFFDCGADGKNGYECTLRIARDGWSFYRIELPFLRAVGEPAGWDSVGALVLDCTRGGQSNRAQTVLYFDHLLAWKSFAPPIYSLLPELKGAAVFSKSGSYTLVDRKKIANTPDGTEARPFDDNGVLWLPMASVAAGLAHSAVVDNRAATLNFTYRRKKYAFVGGLRKMMVDGVESPLKFAPISVEGTLFFPADFVREFFHWRQCFIDPMGLVVLSNRKNIFSSSRDESLIWELIADTSFDRPDGDRMMNDLRRTVGTLTKGRLLATADELMKLRRASREDAVLGGYVSALKTQYGNRSDAFAAAPFGGGAGELADSLHALLGFAMLYRVTGEKIYADRTAAELEAIAAQPDWSFAPAELFGELALTVAIAYDWCRHVWSEGRKALVERTVLRNALRPMLDAYEGKGRMWRAGSVQAATSNMGMLALSVAFADSYPQTAYRLFDRILRNLEPTFAGFAPDGGCELGAGAWESTARAMAITVAILERAFGSDYGFAKAPGFLATAYYPIYLETKNGAWNYHDQPAAPMDTSLHFWFARKTKDTTLAWMRRQELLTGKKNVHPFDVLFYAHVDDSVMPVLALDAVYRKAGLAVMRSDWSREATVLGLHGGDNRVLGATLDAGSVILEMGGERFFHQTGGNDSLPLSVRRRAEGQNTWVIDPKDAPYADQNPDANARIVEMRTAESRAYAVVDMTSTSDQLLRAKRGAMLTESRTVAVIQDEIVLAEPAKFVWRVWTRAAVKLSASGRSAVLEQNGVRMGCKLCGVGSPARFVLETCEASGESCIRVEVCGKDKFRMAVVCRLLGDGDKASETVYDVVPMSRWSEL